jgi:hypothetical protein
MPTSRKISYEYASNPDGVAALLRDPEFLKRRCEAAGEKNVQVRVEEQADGLRVVVERDKEVELPAFAKRMFSPQNRIVDDTRWRRHGDAWVGEYHVAIAGVPGEVKGKSTLAPSAQGCRYESSFEVTSRIPLVGGKLEGWVADKLEETFHQNALRNDEQLKS